MDAFLSDSASTLRCHVTQGTRRGHLCPLDTYMYPVEDGLYYVVLSVRLSVLTSVCPSVNFSCPLHNSDTVQDFHETWYKYKLSSDNVQRTRIDTSPTFFTELRPL